MNRKAKPIEADCMAWVLPHPCNDPECQKRIWTQVHVIERSNHPGVLAVAATSGRRYWRVKASDGMIGHIAEDTLMRIDDDDKPGEISRHQPAPTTVN